MPLPPKINDFMEVPGMFVGRVDFDTVWSFLVGYDVASGGEFLAGFREWMVLKLRSCDNFAWPGLVLHLWARETGKDFALPRTKNQHERTVQATFDLLRAFYDERDAVGVDEIKVRHGEWLRRRKMRYGY
jgi:hypothetical protein